MSGYELAKLIEDERLVIEKQQTRIAELERERDALAAAMKQAQLHLATQRDRSYTMTSQGGRTVIEEIKWDAIDVNAVLAARLAAERKAGAVDALIWAEDTCCPYRPEMGDYPAIGREVLAQRREQIERGEDE